jgi:two-component system, NarL family, response regulator
MAASDKIRILLVDDHPIVRKGLAALIAPEADMQIVAEAGDGEQALALYWEHLPDIALVDLRLPGMSGVEVITAIRRERPDADIIVLTTYYGDEEIYRALQAGAKAYLLKETLTEELLAAIRAVHSGARYIPPAVAARLSERVSKTGLTPRELEVLRLMVQGKRNKEIAAELSISMSTAKVHLMNIFEKLGVSDRSQATTVAIQRGIVRVD